MYARKVLKRKTTKQRQIKFRKAVAVPILLQTGDAQMVQKKDTTKIQSAETKF
jgi:hypothetical protein